MEYDKLDDAINDIMRLVFRYQHLCKLAQRFGNEHGDENARDACYEDIRARIKALAP
jgi:hypothetical protein